MHHLHHLFKGTIMNILLGSPTKNNSLIAVVHYFVLLQPESPAMKKAVSLLSLTTPNSGRKRRRLRETLAQLTKETEISPFPPRKRPSAEHSLSMGSLLDISNTPDTCKSGGGEMNALACHVIQTTN